ncbi:sigma-70 family RNA polymerase sigma factor [Bacteroidia bacterium]|nr:sigma-70 family RNA polymerase sigma factor [Bacteroidia bacterium]
MKSRNQEIERLLSQKLYKEAFLNIMQDFNRPLYALVYRMMSNHNDTDDIMQNALIKIWQNIPKFKGQSSIYTWCYTITKNEALAWIKKKKPTLNLDDVVIREISQPGLDGEQIWEWLTQAVENLPDKQRNVFELKYFMDKTYIEIAEITNTSVGGLKASYHHAVVKIKNEVQKKLIE